MSTEISQSLEEMSRAIISVYGPLLRRKDIAKAMGTSPESLGNTLRRGQCPSALYLRDKKIRFGRRVYYSAMAVAEALLLDSKELKRRSTEHEGGPTDGS